MSINDTRTLDRVTKNFDEITVDSVSTLRTSSFPANLERIYLLGRNTTGDGGEGDFVWDGSDLSTEVSNDEVTAGQGDGGIYIAPESDKTGASGAWVRTGLTFVSPEMYGAKGDGLTDDTAAIKASALANDLVAFTSGSVYIVDTLSFSFGGRNINWQSTGHLNSTLKAKGRTTKDGLWVVFHDPANVEISDLTFDANEQIAVALYIESNSEPAETIECYRSKFLKGRRDSNTGSCAGLSVSYDSSASLRILRVRDCLFDDFYAENGLSSRLLIYKGNVKECNVQGCEFYNVRPSDDGDGIVAQNISIDDSVLFVTGSRFVDCEKRAVKAQANVRLTFDGNTVVRTRDPEYMGVGGGRPLLVDAQGSTNAIVTNNTFIFEPGITSPGDLGGVNMRGDGVIKSNRWINRATSGISELFYRTDDPTRGAVFFEGNTLEGKANHVMYALPDAQPSTPSEAQISTSIKDCVFDEIVTSMIRYGQSGSGYTMIFINAENIQHSAGSVLGVQYDASNTTTKYGNWLRVFGVNFDDFDFEQSFINSNPEGERNDTGVFASNRALDSGAGFDEQRITLIEPDRSQIESRYSRSSVSSSSVLVAKGPGRLSSALVFGEDYASNEAFVDTVTWIQSGGVSVVTGAEQGSPASRSYSTSGSDLQLSVSSGSFRVTAIVTSTLT